MAGNIKEQLKHLTIEADGEVADCRVNDTKEAKFHREKLEEKEKRQQALKLKKEIRSVREKLRTLCKERDDLRKAGNVVRDADMAECAALYTSAAEMIPGIQGLEKRLRGLQKKLEEVL